MTAHNPGNALRWLFSSRHGPTNRSIPRWIFLRALAAIYFSAFFSLLFQIKGLIGPNGILPAHSYLAAVDRAFPTTRFWYAPSLFWLSTSSNMLMAVTWIGLIASLIAFLNLWPRLTLFICFLCFLSFVSSSSDFSSYQSDGMLLEAGFISLFFAPRGIRPGWGIDHPPSRASMSPCNPSPIKITGMPSRVLSRWYRCTPLRRIADCRGVNGVSVPHVFRMIFRACSLV